MYLGILAPKAMTIQIERIASSLGPSPVQLTLPLYSAKRPQLTSNLASGNQVAHKNVVQLLHCPLIPTFVRNDKLLTKIFC